ncbi:MAG: tripartite tricarboxylate transporter TctB family protein [Alphaproteobacteria bacterium]
MNSMLSKRIAWGHVALLIAVAMVVIWYLRDTYTASHQIGNLVFVLPVSVIALALCAVVLVQTVRGRAEEEADAVVPKSRIERYGAGLMMALFALFVLGSDRIGFDVCAYLFIALAILVQGEKRPLMVLGYPALFVAIITYGFKAVVPVPMPTVFF